jgi:hypothetical protein
MLKLTVCTVHRFTLFTTDQSTPGTTLNPLTTDYTPKTTLNLVTTDYTPGTTLTQLQITTIREQHQSLLLITVDLNPGTLH